MPLGFRLHQDFLTYVSTLQDNSIDLIICDPPYFQIKGDFDFEFKNRDEYLQWSQLYLTECKRILKETGTLILWGGVGKKEMMLARLAILIEDNNLFIRQNWVTQRNSRGYGTKKNYMSAREDFLFLTKTENYTFNIPYTEEKSIRKDLGANGKPRKNEFKRVSNVWTDITEASQSSIERCAHPTVKALKLCDRLITTHSNEGDLVLIPFAGSGSEIISALNLNRNVIATEKEIDYITLINDRIKLFTNK